jgi:hypothetical protein
MNIRQEHEFLDEYTEKFPSIPATLSSRERFIEAQEVRVDGAMATDCGDLNALNLDFSQYSGIYLNIFVAGASMHHYNIGVSRSIDIYDLSLEQKFFDEIFKSSKKKPKLEVVEREVFFNSADNYFNNNGLLRVSCTFYPIVDLEKSLLYKLDVSISARSNLPMKYNCKASEDVIVNFLQKCFIVDKRGLFFAGQAKKTMAKTFSLMEEAFLDTKENRIVMIPREVEQIQVKKRG